MRNDQKSMEQWIDIFNVLDATDISPEEAIANRILSDLEGYRRNSAFRTIDVKTLASAIEAYAALVQRHGITVGSVKT